MRYAVLGFSALWLSALLAGCSAVDGTRPGDAPASRQPTTQSSVLVPRPEPPPAPIVPLPPAPLGPAASGKSNCHWSNSLCQVQECKSLLQARAPVAGAVYADLSLARPNAQSVEVRGIAVLAPSGRGNAIPFLCSRNQGQPMNVDFGDRFDWAPPPRP